MAVHKKALESKQNCVEMDRSGRTVEQYTKSCNKTFLHSFGIFPEKKTDQKKKNLHIESNVQIAVVIAIKTTVHAISVRK